MMVARRKRSAAAEVAPSESEGDDGSGGDDTIDVVVGDTLWTSVDDGDACTYVVVRLDGPNAVLQVRPPDPRARARARCA